MACLKSEEEFKELQRLLLISVGSNILNYLEILERPITTILPILEVFYDMKIEEMETLEGKKKGKNKSSEITTDWLVGLGIPEDVLTDFE